MNSIDALLVIVAQNPQIQALRCFRYSIAPKVQARLRDPTAGEKRLIELAQHRKRNQKIRFWDALLLEMQECSLPMERLVREALYHQVNDDYIPIDPGHIRQVFDRFDNEMVALNSRVELRDNKFAHIPLLDFKSPFHEATSALVATCIEALDLKGFLICSGKSYHFIGKKLLEEEELIDILAKFILMHPIADHVWAAHQLLERSASLRITSVADRIEPFVIREIT
jgi:hypothetical protein